MTPKRNEIQEIRQLGMKLLQFACERRPSRERIQHAQGYYRRLTELTDSVSQARLNRFYQQELDFGLEILADPKIKKLGRTERASQSVRTIPVPFESDRRKH